jgi:hypothetical protein
MAAPITAPVAASSRPFSVTSFAGGVCRPVPDNWSPRHEVHFEATWLTHLASHYGQWCRASDVWAPCDAWQRIVLRQRAHEVVQAARRLGWVIEADAALGYRVMGVDDLPRYLHLHERAADREAGVPTCEGQLSLDPSEEAGEGLGLPPTAPKGEP